MKQIWNGSRSIEKSRREYLLWVLSAATFIVFFQAYMVAPLVPKLALLFNAPQQRIGLIVPAYLIPYGIATLFYGLLSDRIGPMRIIFLSLLAFAVLTGLTAGASSVSGLIVWRLLTGLVASGVIPIALALTGQLFSYEERGRPWGWLFGAMAGGSAFGSILGVTLEPIMGWKVLFLVITTVGFVLSGPLWLAFQRTTLPGKGGSISLPMVLRGYYGLLSQVRGLRIYGFLFGNALFQAALTIASLNLFKYEKRVLKIELVIEV